MNRRQSIVASQPSQDEQESASNVPQIVTTFSDTDEQDLITTPVHSQAARRLNLPSESNPPATPRRTRSNDMTVDHSDSDPSPPPSPSPHPTPRFLGLSTPNRPLFSAAGTPHGHLSAFVSPKGRVSAFHSNLHTPKVASSRVTPRRLFPAPEQRPDIEFVQKVQESLSQELVEEDRSRDSSIVSESALPPASLELTPFVCAFDSSELPISSELDCESDEMEQVEPNSPPRAIKRLAAPFTPSTKKKARPDIASDDLLTSPTPAHGKVDDLANSTITPPASSTKSQSFFKLSV